MIVLDNSVLSAFNRLRRLGIIKGLFKETVIPPAVYSEFVDGWGARALPPWINVMQPNEEKMNKCKIFKLGEGEFQSIILAKDYGCLLGVDDEKARNTAKGNGVKVIGSVGILRIAYVKCLLENKKELQKVLEDLSEDLYLENWLKNWVLEAEKE